MKRFVTAVALMSSALFIGGFSQVRAAEPVHLSKDQVKELVENAKTPEDHLKLAAYFNREADRLEAEANEHTALADSYRGHGDSTGAKGPMTGRTAGHCDHFAKAARGEAKADRERAVEHERMANAEK